MQSVKRDKTSPDQSVGQQSSPPRPKTDAPLSSPQRDTDGFVRSEVPRLSPELGARGPGLNVSPQFDISPREGILPRPGLAERFALELEGAPIEVLLAENDALKSEARISPKVQELLSPLAEKAGKILVRERESLNELEKESAKNSEAVRKLRHDLQLLDAEMELSSAGLPAAQNVYSECLQDLAQMYAVRGWTDDQRKSEVEYLQPKLARLSEKLEAAREREDGAEIARIEKKMNALKGLLLSALAGPTQDLKFNETLMPLFGIAMDPEKNELEKSVAWTEITLRMLASTPVHDEDEGVVNKEPQIEENDAERVVVPTGNLEMSFIVVDEKELLVKQAQFELAKNARKLFGPMSDNVRSFAASLESSLRYNPRRNQVESARLLESLSERRNMLAAYLSNVGELSMAKKDERKIETLIYQREADVLDRAFGALGKVAELASKVDANAYERRESVSQDISALEKRDEQAQKEIAAHQKTLNLREYQSLSSALSLLNVQIKETGEHLRNAGFEGVVVQKELKTKLYNLDAAFATIMHRLETLDSEKWLEMGEDPYPANWGIQERLWTTGDERPTPGELMRQYHLAKIGADTVSDAYMQTLRNLYKTGMGAEAFMDNLRPYVIDPDTRKPRAIRGIEDAGNVYLPVIGSIKDFAMRHPVLARDLAANLMHTFSILSSDGSWLSTAKAVLQRKTYEDWVSDATLGGKEHLYTTEVGHTLSPEVIAFLDLAEKAPYIANGIKGAAGGSATGTIAQRLISFVPGGNHPFFQGIAGALGGISEVKAQKIAAAKITRNQEVAANMIWAAVRATNEGRGLQGALSDALGYGAARQALQLAGGAFRSIHEEGVDGFAARNWDRYKTRWQEAPVKETAKTLGATTVGVVATGAAVIGSGMLGTFALAGALPALIIVGGGTVAGWAGLTGYRLVRDNFFVSDEERKKENLERLERWSAKLPKALEETVRRSASTKEARERAGEVLEYAVARLPKSVFSEALAQKGGETKPDNSVMTDEEAQQKYILARVEQEVVALDRERQLEVVKKAKDIATEAGAEVEEDELVVRFRALKDKIPLPDPSGISDPRREGMLQRQIKSGLTQMQEALPASEMERDPVEEELWRRLEKLKTHDVTRAELAVLGTDVETLKIRQIEESALHEPRLRAVWDPNTEIDDELEARLTRLQLPDVPSNARRAAVMTDNDEDLSRRLDALRASSSTKHRRQAVPLKEKK